MRISIGIPTYNRLEYLKIAVSSVMEQTFGEFEICVSQDPKVDGPDPAIFAWCQEALTSNSRVKYNLNISNLGLAGNWNALANMATGDYLMIIGDDDTIEPTFLEEVLKMAKVNDSDVIFSNQRFIDARGDFLAEETEKLNSEFGRKTLRAGIIYDPVTTIFNNSVPMSASIVKRRWFEKFKFDEKLNTPELEFFLKIALSGGRFEYTPKQLSNFRIHGNSATSTGLTVHYFVKNIIDIEVPKSHQANKKKLVNTLMIPAVNICLRSQNRRLAKFLLHSEYYPEGKVLYKFAQNLLRFCPPWIVNKVI